MLKPIEKTFKICVGMSMCKYYMYDIYTHFPASQYFYTSQ